ncbi:MAG: hypothetical protein R3F65_28390 [bacterium]
MPLPAAFTLLILAIAVPITPRKPPPPDDTDTPDALRLTVDWNITHATDGCFFFAGPAPLGRDDSHGPRAGFTPGPRPTGTVGAAAFTGTSTRLTRTSKHHFHGPWTATETLTGTLAPDGRFTGTYRYAECESGQTCPGRCRIEATVRWHPDGRCGAGDTVSAR